MICSFNFLIFLAVCLNISTVINIKILTNSNQQTQSYAFISHIAAFLSVVLITEMLKICIQISYDQNVQLILKSYLSVVYGTLLTPPLFYWGACTKPYRKWTIIHMVAVCKCIDFTSVSRGRRGRDGVVVVYPTTYSISAYQNYLRGFESHS